MSMASGEYVSVNWQPDSERADIAREGKELRHDRAGETRELADIYVRRGLDMTLAMKVAKQLMVLSEPRPLASSLINRSWP